MTRRAASSSTLSTEVVVIIIILAALGLGAGYFLVYLPRQRGARKYDQLTKTGVDQANRQIQAAKDFQAARNRQVVANPVAPFSGPGGGVKGHPRK